MRTTIAIDDNLLEAAKRQARASGMTLGELLEEALRRELARRTERSPSPGPSVPVFSGGGGARTGVDMASNRAILETLEEGQPPQRLR